MSTKVGLVACTVTPRPRASPWMKQVFPAPSSPTSATTSPGPSVWPSRSPAAAVSSGLRLRISAGRVGEPPEHGGEPADHPPRDKRLLAHPPRSEGAAAAVWG